VGCFHHLGNDRPVVGFSVISLIVVPLALEDRFRMECLQNAGNHREIFGFLSFPPNRYKHRK
jgi:hypothetical protein